MKTTVDIPDEALEEVMKHTGAKTKREAIVAAIDAYNRRKRLARLVDDFGTFDQFMTQDELSQLRRDR